MLRQSFLLKPVLENDSDFSMGKFSFECHDLQPHLLELTETIMLPEPRETKIRLKLGMTFGNATFSDSPFNPQRATAVF